MNRNAARTHRYTVEVTPAERDLATRMAFLQDRSVAAMFRTLLKEEAIRRGFRLPVETDDAGRPAIRSVGGS